MKWQVYLSSLSHVVVMVIARTHTLLCNVSPTSGALSGIAFGICPGLTCLTFHRSSVHSASWQGMPHSRFVHLQTYVNIEVQPPQYNENKHPVLRQHPSKLSVHTTL